MPDVEMGEGDGQGEAQGEGEEEGASPFRQPRARPLAYTDGGRMSNASRKPGGLWFPTSCHPAPRLDIYPPLLRPCRHRRRPSAQRGYTRGRQGLGRPAGPGTGLELS